MDRQQRTVLVVAILASLVAFLDGTVVNVALPAIDAELGGGLAGQQWVVDAYLLTLGAVILLAGSLSDAFGRRRVLAAGLIGFGVTSLLCAVAPSIETLVIARGLQGLAGALLVPSSLAIIMQTFRGESQGRAIGIWTAGTTAANLAGPFLGGLLVDVVSWRSVFAINVVPIAITLLLVRTMAPDPARVAGRRVDIPGAVLGVAAIGLPVFGLIEQGRLGWGSPVVLVSLAVGAVLFVAFVLYERSAPQPLLPLSLFRIGNFGWGNLATTFIYGALGLAMFAIALFLQQIAGYSATLAGLATLPSTVLLIVLSGPSGKLSARWGARPFMTVGPLLCGVGFLLLLRVDSQAAYVTEVLPGILVFGFGLAITVAPLTSAVLGSVDAERSGIASAVNNAVSRVAGLIMVALAGVITAGDFSLAGFHRIMLVTAVLMLLGAVVSWAGILRPVVSAA